MDMKIIIILTTVIITGCTSNYRCTDTFSKQTCMSIFNGISGGMEKHNQRMSEYNEAREWERFSKRMKKLKYPEHRK